MRFFYDCEFHESAMMAPIDLISIGVVAEDGREFYRVCVDAQWGRITHGTWLADNVLPHLPGSWFVGGMEVTAEGAARNPMDAIWGPDTEDERVVGRRQLREDLLAFLRPSEASPAEMWAWYGDYDHVVLSQLFGRMVDLPTGMPMYTRDLKQHVDTLDSMWQQGVFRVPGVEEAQRTTTAGLGRLIEPYGDAARSVPDDESEHDALADARVLHERYLAVHRLLGVAL